ncbi:LapA family protein [Psychrobium sp. 1_MG-2023]|uniref:LapA family protein n=1 Tax=Psychrobium sp. 1_MG-2023 TaxID=3062624 RepID=UPI000C33C713|nr:lipopolysaccharide assembly protein LapA domain-containing protein [Psychrobium sp. 1_MG-2023]MDP2560334.1 lipopolysaccharide assembly protein LapA domain-containing protein [Psychrobium sp. 1_MG-2023]PKF55445.1 DUF1049 domain-containing protein [Alteromonadales bacterium alter-6D02]
MKSVIATIVVILFFVMAMIFSASNKEMVTINYLIAQGSFNVSHVIGLAFISGFVICWFIFYSLYIGLKIKLNIANKKITRLADSPAPVVAPTQEKQITSNV